MLTAGQHPARHPVINFLTLAIIVCFINVTDVQLLGRATGRMRLVAEAGHPSLNLASNGSQCVHIPPQQSYQPFEASLNSLEDPYLHRSFRVRPAR